MLSFTIEQINKNEIPLESIAKFFKAHGVGDVSEIHVAPFYIIDLGETTISSTYVRLYVHFNLVHENTDMYDNFKLKIANGENIFPIANTIIDDEIKILLSRGTTSLSINKRDVQGVNIYKFNINLDTWDFYYNNSWNITLVQSDNDYTKYTNIHTDHNNSFKFLEDVYRRMRNISDEYNNVVATEPERRIDMCNPNYDFTQEFTSESGAIGFTQEEFEELYGINWQHYWYTSDIWEEYIPVIHNVMTVRIELTIGPYNPPYNYVMKRLTSPITEIIDEIHYLSHENYNIVDKSIMMDRSYYTAYLQCNISNICYNEYNTIKNYLLDIEQMCDIIKPKDIYDGYPKSKIYTSFT